MVAKPLTLPILALIRFLLSIVGDKAISRGNRPAYLQCSRLFVSLFDYAFVVSLSALGVGHKRDSCYQMAKSALGSRVQRNSCTNLILIINSRDTPNARSKYVIDIRLDQ